MSYFDVLNNTFNTTYRPPTLMNRLPLPPRVPGASDTSTRFSQRGVPEALQVEDFVPEVESKHEIGGIPGAIDTAFRFPAYVPGRPLALIDELSKSPGNEKGVITNVVEGVRDIPLVGAPISALGDVAEDAFEFTFGAGNLIAQPANTAIASLWAGQADKSEDRALGIFDELQSILPIIGAGQDVFKFLNPFDEITKSDLRAGLNEIGWTNEDLNDIETGKKGWMDFSEKSLRLGILPGGIGRQAEDFMMRALGDPLNLLMGAGVLSKAGLIFRGGKAVTAAGMSGKPIGKALRQVKIDNAARKAAPSQVGKKALPVDEGAVVFGEGSIRGVGKVSVSRYIMSRLRDPIKGYRDLSLGSTTLQIGLNATDQLLEVNGEPQDGFLGDVFDFARRWGANKPLSKNDLFTLYMIMKVPGRTMAAAATKPLKNKRNTGQFKDLPEGEFAKGGRALQHENQAAEFLHPELVTVSKGKGKNYAAAKAEVVRRLGSETAAQAAYSHILKTALHKKNFLEGVPSLPNLLHVTSMAQAGQVVDRYSKIMNSLVNKALQEGTVRQRDITAALRGFTATRGGALEDLTRGVQQQNFRSEDFYTAWGQWERLATKTSQAFKDGFAGRPGITADLITTDDIMWALVNLDALKVGKTITGDQMMDILGAIPAVFNFPGGEKLARALTRDGVKKTYDVAEIKTMLNKIDKDHAISRAEYTASYEAWEEVAKANELAWRLENKRMTEGGKMRPETDPGVAGATSTNIPGNGVDDLLHAQAEVGGAGMQVIKAIRTTTEGMAFRFNLMAGLKLGGFNVRGAVDTVVLMADRSGRNGMAVPGISIRIAPGMPLNDVKDVMYMGMERSTTNRVTTVWRGADEIKDAGMTVNAKELTYQRGKVTDSEWDNIINKLHDEFGDRVTINAHTGQVTILIPNGLRGGGVKRLANADRMLGGVKATDEVAMLDMVKRSADANGANHVVFRDHGKTIVRSRRYQITSELIDEGVGGYPNGSAQRAREGFTERARAEGRGEYSLRQDGSVDTVAPTRWEHDNGGGVLGSSDEFAVGNLHAAGGATNARWTEKLRQSGVLDTPHGDAFTFRPGDRLYASNGEGRSFGVVVRDTGEVIPWRLHKDKPLPGDWESVLAESTREGTWARFIDNDPDATVQLIEVLGKHGYVPAVRGRVTTGAIGDDLEDIIYMLFDPENRHGFDLGLMKWRDAKPNHKSMKFDPKVARAQIMGYVESLHPERMKRMAQITVDGQLLAKQRALAAKEGEVVAKTNELTGADLKRAQERGMPVRAAADDVAPNPRDIPPEGGGFTPVQAASAAERTITGKGGTFLPDGLGDYNGGGFAVSDGPAIVLAADASADDIAKAIQKVHDDFPDADVIGTWVNDTPEAFAKGEQGVYIEPSTVRERVRDAHLLGSARGEIAIFDLATGASIDVKRITTPLGGSGTYTRLIKERNRMRLELSTDAAKAKSEIILEGTIQDGNVVFIEQSERGVEHVRPRLDESIEGNLDSLPPGQIEKVFEIEAEMRLTGSYVDNTGKLVDASNYRLKRLPKQAAPYQGMAVESEAYRQMVGSRIAAEDGWRTTTTSKMAQGMDLLFGRVYAVELQVAQRQEVYNQLLNEGATVGEVNKFLKALQAQWEDQTFSFLGARPIRSADMLTPRTINKLGKGGMTDSKVFSDGFAGDWAKTYDFADMMQRSGSRTYRKLATRFPATEGRGNLGKIIETFYGREGSKLGTVAKLGVRRPVYGLTVAYTVLRFMLDPRWYAMNAFEADILGMARWGSKVRGVVGGKARGTGIRGHLTGKDATVARDPFVERMAARRKDSDLLTAEEMLHANSGAAGWMDQRNLYGFVAQAAKIERPQLAAKAFQKMTDEGSPVIDDLIARHGKNEAAWIDEIDDLLYNIDTQGAKRTVLDNELAQIMINDPALGPAYETFITNLWKQQRQMFKDVTHTFHGNINRSNMERLANSPLLWWPLSYQLKTGKWLIDVMSKGFLGHPSELAGLAGMAKLLDNHRYKMETDTEYVKMFDDHPALFRALSMMLPITPFDMGTFMARWTRYAGSWTGAQLGLWDQDPSYPQDPANFMVRSLALGPVYSGDILGDIIQEVSGSGDNKFPERKN